MDRRPLQSYWYPPHLPCCILSQGLNARQYVPSILQYSETPYSGFNRIHTRHETVPIIAEERSIQFLQALFGATIHGDVELGNRRDSTDFFRELSVGDQEGWGTISTNQRRQMSELMKEIDELINLRIHDGFTYQWHGTVLQRHGFLHPILLNTFTTCKLLNQTLFENHLWNHTRWFTTIPWYTSSAGSIFHLQVRPVGLEWCLQQNKQRFAQAREGVASIQDALFKP